MHSMMHTYSERTHAMWHKTCTTAHATHPQHTPPGPCRQSARPPCLRPLAGPSAGLSAPAGQATLHVCLGAQQQVRAVWKAASQAGSQAFWPKLNLPAAPNRSLHACTTRMHAALHGPALKPCSLTCLRQPLAQLGNRARARIIRQLYVPLCRLHLRKASQGEQSEGWDEHLSPMHGSQGRRRDEARPLLTQ